MTPESAPFDVKAYAKLTPEEKGKYLAGLFVQTMNHNANLGVQTS